MSRDGGPVYELGRPDPKKLYAKPKELGLQTKKPASQVLPVCHHLAPVKQDSTQIDSPEFAIAIRCPRYELLLGKTW